MSDIRTRPATKEYRDNFDKVFGKPKKDGVERTRRWCPLCRGTYFVGRLHNCKVIGADIRRRLKG